MMSESKIKAFQSFNRAFKTVGPSIARFETRNIPHEHSYVAWIDIMGASSFMRKSLADASDRIGKFHAAILNAYGSFIESNKKSSDVSVHVLTDGAFVVSHSAQRLQAVLRDIMTSLVETFLVSSTGQKFMTRCAVAAGDIVTSATMSDRIFWKKGFKDESWSLTRNIMLGAPFEKAYHLEGCAPPLGVFVDGSALGNEAFGMRNVWEWWDTNNRDQVLFIRDFRDAICDYLDFLKNNYYMHELDPGKIENYKARVVSYFGSTI